MFAVYSSMMMMTTLTSMLTLMLLLRELLLLFVTSFGQYEINYHFRFLRLSSFLDSFLPSSLPFHFIVFLYCIIIIVLTASVACFFYISIFLLAYVNYKKKTTKKLSVWHPYALLQLFTMWLMLLLLMMMMTLLLANIFRLCLLLLQLANKQTNQQQTAFMSTINCAIPS